MISVNDGEVKVGVSSTLSALYNIPIDDEEVRKVHVRSIIKSELCTDMGALLLALSKRYTSDFALECVEGALDFFKEHVNDPDLHIENMMERKNDDDTLL